MSTLTCHVVTRNPDAAAAWYGSVLGAVEVSRHDEVVRLAAAAFAGDPD